MLRILAISSHSTSRWKNKRRAFTLCFLEANMDRMLLAYMVIPAVVVLSYYFGMKEWYR
jgi:hypothetical protein